jgi:ribulose-5-phosphate 4-epimerase/fuculose-1-phosphate aldolase
MAAMPDSPAQRLEVEGVRAAVVAAGRRLGARGLISAGEGNLSVRLDATRMLITPSGRRKDELDPADLPIIPLDPGREDGAEGAKMDATLGPSSDVAIHRAIYAARPDVGAVVHAHLPAAMALTLAGEVPDPAILPETAMLLPRLPYVTFAPPGSAILAAAIANALVTGLDPLPGAVLLERHGAVAVGDAGPAGMPLTEHEASGRLPALDQAVDRLELVEVLCRTWRDALMIRAAGLDHDARAILRPPSSRPGVTAAGRPRRNA